jgi:hypothetical protein
MNDTTVKIRVPTEELKRWREESGKRGLSAWIRERCNGKDHSSEGVREGKTVRVGKRGFDAVERVVAGEENTSVEAKRGPSVGVVFPRGKCPHHKERGEVCYKCDHQFGMPSIAE